MNDFSNLNHLPAEIKELIVTGQALVNEANLTLADRNCSFDLTSKRQLKGDIRNVEKAIQAIEKGKTNKKTFQQLAAAVTCLRTTHTGLVAFFTR